MSPKPGEVWLADLGLAAKTRPVVVVSREDPNAPRALVLYVPLTTQIRNSNYEVRLPQLPFSRSEFRRKRSGPRLDPNGTIGTKTRLGRLPTPAITQLKAALAFALDLA